MSTIAAWVGQEDTEMERRHRSQIVLADLLQGEFVGRR